MTRGELIKVPRLIQCIIIIYIKHLVFFLGTLKNCISLGVSVFVYGTKIKYCFWKCAKHDVECIFMTILVAMSCYLCALEGKALQHL